MSRQIIAAVAHDSDAADAVALGVTLARAHGATLVLAGVYVAPFGPRDRALDHVVAEDVEAELARLAASVPDDVACQTRAVGATSVVRGLHELAEAEGAEMLVLGPTHLGKAARAVGGDVTLGAIHTAPCTVAIAPAGFAGRAPQVIGVAYDGSPESAGALQTAADLAIRMDGTVRVLSVLPTPYAFADEAGSGDREGHYLFTVRDEMQARLEEARGSIADRVETEAEMLKGDPADQLLGATEGLDVLVMGSRGYGPVKRVLLGSVTAQLAHQAHCALIVIPRGVEAIVPNRVPAAAQTA